MKPKNPLKICLLNREISKFLILASTLMFSNVFEYKEAKKMFIRSLFVTFIVGFIRKPLKTVKIILIFKLRKHFQISSPTNLFLNETIFI